MKFFNITLVLAVVSCAIIGAFSAPADTISADSVNQAVDDASNTAKDASDNINNQVQDAIDNVSQAIQNPGDAINGAVSQLSEAAEGIQSSLQDITNQAGNLGLPKNIVSSLVTKAGSAAQDMVNKAIGSVQGPIQKTLDGAGQKLNEAFQEAVKQVGEIEKCAQNNNQSALPSDGIEQLTKCVVTEIETAEDAVQNVVGAIGKSVGLLVEVPTKAVGCFSKGSGFFGLPKVGTCLVGVGIDAAGSAVSISAKFVQAGSSAVQILFTSFGRASTCIAGNVASVVEKAGSAGVDLGKCLQSPK